ncbi:MAG: thiol reductant ABC exporter subunit CydC [Ilumatobacteraceae bacterium]
MNALWRVLRLGRSGRLRLWGAVALGVLAAGAAVTLAGTSAWLIARAAEEPPVLHLMVAIVAVRAAGIGRGVFRYAERLLSHDASFRVLTDLRVAVVRQVSRLLPGNATVGHGDLLARFVGDVDGLADLWVRVLLPAAVTLVVGAGAIGMMVALLPVAGLVLALSFTVAVVAAPWLSIRFAGRASARVAPARGAAQQRLLTVLDGAAELTVYGAVDTALAELGVMDDELRRAEARTAWGAGLGTAVAVVAAGGGLLLSLWFGARAVADGELSGVALAVVVLLPLSVHELVALLTPAAAQLPALAASARRLLAVLDAPEPAVEPVAPQPVPDGPLGVRLTDVTLAWPGGPAVQEGLSFEVAAGSTVALVGPSGVGKSTLAATLLRFIPAAGGCIELIGGARTVDCVQLAGDDLRAAVGWCAQDAHLFDSTVAANLRLARPAATDEELIAALHTAQLRPWFERLPDGLQTMIGEHGHTLSGGERQRLALARVVLTDTRVVVLDEPTEHLDDATAGSLLRDLLAALAGRTLILITHRRDLLPEGVPVIELAAGT